jgi:hypothetical protein
MRRAFTAATFAAVVIASLPAPAAADTVDARCDIYPKGSDRVLAVLPCSFSQRQGHVRISRSDGIAYELAPAGQGPGRYLDAQGRAAYRQRGLGARGQIYRLAEVSVFVYWDTAGLPDRSTTSVPVAAPPTRLPAAAPPPVPFELALSLQGTDFRLGSRNDGSINALTIDVTGLAKPTAPLVRDMDGQAVGAEVVDLDVDGRPELYVYVRSAGSGSYGSLLAWAVGRDGRLIEIVLPPLADTPGAGQGYMGHDQFAVVEGALVRRFPVYRTGDTNAAPSGGVRQLQYRLRPAMAGPRLEVERVVEY